MGQGYNPYRDEKGRFASGASSGSSLGGGHTQRRLHRLAQEHKTAGILMIHGAPSKSGSFQSQMNTARARIDKLTTRGHKGATVSKIRTLGSGAHRITMEVKRRVR